MNIDGAAEHGPPAVNEDFWHKLDTRDLPIARAEVELSAPGTELSVLGDPPGSSKIMTLVRLHTHPLGVMFLDGRRGPSWRAHAASVWSSMGNAINSHLASDGLDQLAGPEDLP